MIESYLRKQEKWEETSTVEGMDALEGETITKIIPLDKDKYMILMKSGASCVVHTAGSFTIYTKEKTTKILQEVTAKSKNFSIIHSRAKLALDQLAQENQQKNEQNKTGAE